MDPLQLLMVCAGIAVPIAVYFWRESRYQNPAVRWKQLAPVLELSYEADPPRVSGSWKGRELVVAAQEDGTAVLSLPLRAGRAVRVEIGPRADVEKDAGIIVPDRVRFPGLADAAFENRFMVRATPVELGETATDAAFRQRLMAMPDVRILAGGDRLDMVFPLPTEARTLRDWMDIAASLADAVDGN
ncbi:MAG TPA: hypothetical protein VNI01_07935 [Elusimicrobiota bacterium]|jgi:hypothetical protein|nr:hypothetical protein [Elusimicrobiota bacterium]